MVQGIQLGTSYQSNSRVVARGQTNKGLAFLSDQILFFTTLIVVAFGLVMIYSTTAVVAEEKFGDALFFVKRQGLAAAIGIVFMIGAANLNLNKLKQYTHILFPISLFLLLLIFIPGFGLKGGGALRWIGFGPLRFQPVEIVKVLMIFFTAGYVSRYEKQMPTFKYGIAMPLVILSLIGFPLLLQPDFGSAVVISLLVMIVMFAAGSSLKFIALGSVFLGGLASVLVLISPYRLKRILAFLDPFSDSSGQGYQLIQSLIAIGNGGLSGVGIGESQQKLFFLPAAHNDFIFAVIGEELGFIGCATLLLLFLVILWRGIRTAVNFSNDSYYFGLSLGLTLLIVIPAILNMGVALGLLPTKGLVLPLVSYGGSSLIASLVAIGLLLAVCRVAGRRKI